MNTSPCRPRFFTTLKFLIALCAIAGLSGCSSTVKLNYVNWEVEFTKGTSEADKAIAMDSIRRYIFQTLSEKKDSALYLRQINIKIENLPDHDRATIGVFLRFGEAGQTGTAPPPPHGGPGHDFTLPPTGAIPNIQRVVHIAESGH
jgi:hypothetical protein